MRRMRVLSFRASQLGERSAFPVATPGSRGVRTIPRVARNVSATRSRLFASARARSRSICWFLLAATLLLAERAHGQTAAQASASAPLTTLVGVYTDSQAARGKDVYAGSCRSCHTPVSHTGVMFAKWWLHKPLSDLYTFVAKNMPKNDPGSLDPYDAADVVAYLLKMNQMPVGPGDMPPDVDSLKKYRIEVKRSSRSTKSSTAKSSAKRKKP